MPANLLGRKKAEKKSESIFDENSLLVEGTLGTSYHNGGEINAYFNRLEKVPVSIYSQRFGSLEERVLGLWTWQMRERANLYSIPGTLSFEKAVHKSVSIGAGLYNEEFRATGSLFYMGLKDLTQQYAETYLYYSMFRDVPADMSAETRTEINNLIFIELIQPRLRKYSKVLYRLTTFDFHINMHLGTDKKMDPFVRYSIGINTEGMRLSVAFGLRYFFERHYFFMVEGTSNVYKTGLLVNNSIHFGLGASL